MHVDAGRAAGQQVQRDAYVALYGHPRHADLSPDRFYCHLAYPLDTHQGASEFRGFLVGADRAGKEDRGAGDLEGGPADRPAGDPSAARIKADMAYLASDRLKGREAGTAEYDMAARYVMDQMKQIAQVTPKLKGEALRRAKAAIKRILKTPEPLDVSEARARFDVVMARGQETGARADPTEGHPVAVPS